MTRKNLSRRRCFVGKSLTFNIHLNVHPSLLIKTFSNVWQRTFAELSIYILTQHQHNKKRIEEFTLWASINLCRVLFFMPFKQIFFLCQDLFNSAYSNTHKLRNKCCWDGKRISLLCWHALVRFFALSSITNYCMIWFNFFFFSFSKKPSQISVKMSHT